MFERTSKNGEPDERFVATVEDGNGETKRIDKGETVNEAVESAQRWCDRLGVRNHRIRCFKPNGSEVDQEQKPAKAKGSGGQAQQ